MYSFGFQYTMTSFGTLIWEKTVLPFITNSRYMNKPSTQFALYAVLFRIWNNTTHRTSSNIPWICWEKFQWILPLYMKPISFQWKASVVCSVTAAIFIGFCLKKLNVFSQHIGEKTNEYLNSAEQIPRNWNVDQLSMLITSWDII